MFRVCLLLVISAALVGCGGWGYKTNDRVTFEIRSWNHEPLIYVVDKADIKSFRDIGEGFGKDKFHVFYKGDEIPGAKPSTFEHIRWAYSKDSNSVYLFTCKLENAAPNTFQVLDGSWSKDEKNVYHGHRRVEADTSSFRYVGNNWAVDNTNAYHALSMVPSDCDGSSLSEVKIYKNIDAATFKVIDALRAQDKNGVINALPSPNKALHPTVNLTR